MFAIRPSLVLLVIPSAVLAAPPAAAPGDKSPGSASDIPSVPVVRLAPQAATPPARALKYSLLPERHELRPGNAALPWVRAGQIARDLHHKNFDDRWARSGPDGTPLKDLPKKQIREALNSYAAALRFADEAARRDYCTWDLPPPRLLDADIPFAEFSDYRLLANVLCARCRLEISDGQFDKAAHTLQTGLALARHLGDGDIVIQPVLGIAIASLMFGVVEEWMQVPDSPNLYWPLAALPVPFIDVRRSLAMELSSLDQVRPQLQGFRKDIGDRAVVDVVVARLFAAVHGPDAANAPEWQMRLALAIVCAKSYPEARRDLLAAGYTAEGLDAMSPVQVVIAQWLDQMDQYRDEVLKNLSLPPWQGRAGLEDVTRKVIALKARYRNPVVTLLFPAVGKVFEARVRLERTVAGLRCGEALRLYAAHHGKAPDKLTDMATVPLPVDPVTGKGFEGFYKAKDGHGVLDVPPLPSQSPLTGRRFEIGPAR
jgi:hypothetical protein